MIQYLYISRLGYRFSGLFLCKALLYCTKEKRRPATRVGRWPTDNLWKSEIRSRDVLSLILESASSVLKLLSTEEANIHAIVRYLDAFLSERNDYVVEEAPVYLPEI